jgi:hypothetical protein
MTSARGRWKDTEDGRAMDNTWSRGADCSATIEPVAVRLVHALEELIIKSSQRGCPTELTHLHTILNSTFELRKTTSSERPRHRTLAVTYPALSQAYIFVTILFPGWPCISHLDTKSLALHWRLSDILSSAHCSSLLPYPHWIILDSRHVSRLDYLLFARVQDTTLLVCEPFSLRILTLDLDPDGRRPSRLRYLGAFGFNGELLDALIRLLFACALQPKP